MRYHRFSSSTITKVKSEMNAQKHGIDFTGAQLLWEDPDLIEIPTRTVDEPRFLVIGRIQCKHWSGTIACRGSSTRIISVRGSRGEEIETYEGGRTG